jgi:hypothetical protein
VKSIATALLATAVLAAPTFTQDLARAPEAPRSEAPVAEARVQPQPPQAPQAPQATQERQPAEERERTLPPPPPPGPPPPGERRPLPLYNVKVDVTITDQTGTGTPMKKVVSMVVADGRSSGVRSMTSVPLATGGPNRDLPLNVDATANVTPERKVLLDLRFNYSSVSFVTPVGSQDRPAPTTDQERAMVRDLTAPRAAVSNITENLSILLTPGTPFVVARSADAAADRTVTVEVKAEILK